MLWAFFLFLLFSRLECQHDTKRCGSHPGMQSDKPENDDPAWDGRMEKWKDPGSLSASLLPSLLASGMSLFSHCPSESVFPAAQSIATWYRHFWIRKIKSFFLLISK